jgi:hypothetical protein
LGKVGKRDAPCECTTFGSIISVDPPVAQRAWNARTHVRGATPLDLVLDRSNLCTAPQRHRCQQHRLMQRGERWRVLTAA